MKQMNTKTLAYMGDSVYELYIRECLINKDMYNVNDLQKASLLFVSAKNQRKHLERLIEACFLSDEEIEIYKRGRNAKGGKSKSSDIVTYRIATGLECLIGYLYLNERQERVKEIMAFIVGE